MALHPLLLPILATELATERGRFMIDLCKKEAEGVERKTGQSPFDRKENAKPEDRELPNIRLEAISVICKCSIHLEGTKSRLLCLEQARQLLSENTCDLSSPKQCQEASTKLRDFIGYLASKNENLLNKVQLAQLRAETQLAVVGTQPPRPEG
jgi:hypothetical protein